MNTDTIDTDIRCTRVSIVTILFGAGLAHGVWIIDAFTVRAHIEGARIAVITLRVVVTA